MSPSIIIKFVDSQIKTKFKVIPTELPGANLVSSGLNKRIKNG